MLQLIDSIPCGTDAKNVEWNFFSELRLLQKRTYWQGPLFPKREQSTQYPTSSHLEANYYTSVCLGKLPLLQVQVSPELEMMTGCCATTISSLVSYCNMPFEDLV